MGQNDLTAEMPGSVETTVRTPARPLVATATRVHKCHPALRLTRNYKTCSTPLNLPVPVEQDRIALEGLDSQPLLGALRPLGAVCLQGLGSCREDRLAALLRGCAGGGQDGTGLKGMWAAAGLDCGEWEYGLLWGWIEINDRLH